MSVVSPEVTAKSAKSSKASGVHLLIGASGPLLDAKVAASRRDSFGDSTDFDTETFDGSQHNVAAVLAAARTVPMWTAKRFVWLRRAEDLAAADHNALASYFEDPSPSTCLVISAAKLDGRSRLVQTAKRLGCCSEVEVPKGAALKVYLRDGAASRGHRLLPAAMEALLDALGDDVAAHDDALERLSLFVGPKVDIDAAAVGSCVTHCRVETIWALVDAVASRNAAAVLRCAASLLADREPPLRILAMVARQLRSLARMRAALSAGQSANDAAKQAGIPPFKARDLATAAQKFSESQLRRAFQLLARTDEDLKSSRCPPDVVLQQALWRMCS